MRLNGHRDKDCHIRRRCSDLHKFRDVRVVRLEGRWLGLKGGGWGGRDGIGMAIPENEAGQRIGLWQGVGGEEEGGAEAKDGDEGLHGVWALASR